MNTWAKRLLEKTRDETPYKLIAPVTLPLLLLYALVLLAWALTLLGLDSLSYRVRRLRRRKQDLDVWGLTNAEFLDRLCRRYGISRELEPEEILDLAARCNLVAKWRIDQGRKVSDKELLAEVDALPEEFVHSEEMSSAARKRAFLLERERQLGQDGERFSTDELVRRSQDRTLLAYHALILEQARALGHSDPTFRPGRELIAYLEEHEPGASERLLKEAMRSEEMDDETVHSLLAEQRAMKRELAALDADAKDAEDAG